MEKRKQNKERDGNNVADYRHKTSKRLNIPLAGLEAQGHDLDRAYLEGIGYGV